MVKYRLSNKLWAESVNRTGSDDQDTLPSSSVYESSRKVLFWSEKRSPTYLKPRVNPREALNKTGVVSWYETTGEL